MTLHIINNVTTIFCVVLHSFWCYNKSIENRVGVDLGMVHNSINSEVPTEERIKYGTECKTQKKQRKAR